MSGDHDEATDRVEPDESRGDATDAVTGPVGDARLRTPAEIGDRDAGLDDLTDLEHVASEVDEEADADATANR